MKRLLLIATTVLLFMGCKETRLVPSASMEKTLNYGERIVVQYSEKYRCIAKENDSIEIKDNIVYLNGEKLDEKYCYFDETIKPQNNEYDGFLVNLEKITVPKNTIFVLCDNRWNSLDSRYKGPISCENILGKVLYVSDMDNPFKKIRVLSNN